VLRGEVPPTPSQLGASNPKSVRGEDADGFWLVGDSFSGRWRGLWEVWETRVVGRGAFSKGCGKAAGLLAGFP
jgi:hypothetical protein